HIARRTRFIKKQFKNIFQRADAVQCISHYLADWAKKMGATCPIVVIPNGVDIKNFSREYSEKELNELKQKLNKESEDKFLITTSRLTHKNGVGDLIKSFVYLPENIKLLIIGTGEDEKKLKKITQERNLKNRVKFLGFIDHKEIPKYLKISDIFIRPSLSEGLGNSFLEAMVAKVPVIATPVGGIPDFLKDKETGFFCQAENPESIAEQVKYLLNNPAITETIVKNARQLVLQKYNWDKIIKDMRRIFNKLFI
ncbi:MAG: glycosyltransferase family 4 protein, partial [Patescibacteria group bacterium]